MAQSISMKERMPSHYSWQFWLLATFLCVVFLSGGSSRLDVQSLAILRPVSAIVLGAGFASLNVLDRQFRTVGFISLAIILITSFYLIPFGLSDGSRQSVGLLIHEIDRITGLDQNRALAAVPHRALNSFQSLLTPLAVLVLAAQLRQHELYGLLPLLLALVFISGMFGLLQILSGSNSSFYLYMVTNKGAAVGLFANRNHQALLLAIIFPMLAVFSLKGGQLSWRNYSAVVVGIFIVPLILVTGSRAGFAFGIFAIFVGLFIFRLHWPLVKGDIGFSQNRWLYPSIGLLTLALVVLTFYLSRATAIERIMFGDKALEGRGDFWSVVSNMLESNLPYGIGPGSFNAAYGHVEPRLLLDSTYLNQAHNDWLEVGLSFGWLGIGLLLFVVTAVLVRTVTMMRDMKNPSQQTAYAILGATIILLIAVGSALDYPLRTPNISAIFVIAVIWFTSSSNLKTQKSVSTSRREEVPDDIS